MKLHEYKNAEEIPATTKVNQCWMCNHYRVTLDIPDLGYCEYQKEESLDGNCDLFDEITINF